MANHSGNRGELGGNSSNQGMDVALKEAVEATIDYLRAVDSSSGRELGVEEQDRLEGLNSIQSISRVDLRETPGVHFLAAAMRMQLSNFDAQVGKMFADEPQSTAADLVALALVVNALYREPTLLRGAKSLIRKELNEMTDIAVGDQDIEDRRQADAARAELLPLLEEAFNFAQMSVQSSGVINAQGEIARLPVRSLARVPAQPSQGIAHS